MKYLPNPNFLGELQKDDEYIDGVRKCAESIMREASAEKHRIMPNKDHSAVVVGVEDGMFYVSNTDSGAHIDEYGSVNNPAYSPMRRAVRSAGFRLSEEPK